MSMPQTLRWHVIRPRLLKPGGLGGPEAVHSRRLILDAGHGFRCRRGRGTLGGLQRPQRRELGGAWPAVLVLRVRVRWRVGLRLPVDLPAQHLDFVLLRGVVVLQLPDDVGLPLVLRDGWGGGLVGSQRGARIACGVGADKPLVRISHLEALEPRSWGIRSRN